jgi:hypothetical protein
MSNRVTYTDELAAEFCAAIAEGSRSIRAVCALPGMPGKSTVFEWMRTHPEFLAMYELAKDEQADTFIDEVVEIADTCAPDKEAIQKAKLQIYARIEAAQKMKPRKYGAKVQTELTGPNGGPLQFARIERVIVRPVDPDA